MDKQEALEIIENLQNTVEQMKIDDLDEYPEAALEEFKCQCCGEVKILAGSITYGECKFCNDCVLIAETGLALGKIKDVEELLIAMEDKRFENLYKSIFEEQENSQN